MSNFNILNKIKNPLLKREEIKLQINSDSNPSFTQIIDYIGIDKDLVVIKKVSGNFGLNNFVTDVFVYDSKEAKEKIEVIPRKIRKKMQEEAKKAEEAKIAQEKADEAKRLEEAKKAEELANSESKEGEKVDGS